jgi:hypothetical protein
MIKQIYPEANQKVMILTSIKQEKEKENQLTMAKDYSNNSEYMDDIHLPGSTTIMPEHQILSPKQPHQVKSGKFHTTRKNYNMDLLS